MWALWTTKDGFESWWGPEGFRVDVHELDARVGGALDYDMIADAPAQVEAMKRMGQAVSHKTHGTFTELRPRERLVLTHIIDFLPGGDAVREHHHRGVLPGRRSGADGGDAAPDARRDVHADAGGGLHEPAHEAGPAIWLPVVIERRS